MVYSRILLFTMGYFIKFFSHKSSRVSVYFIFTSHLSLGQIHFVSSVTTQSWQSPCWAAQLWKYWQQGYREVQISILSLSKSFENWKSSYEKHLPNSTSSLWNVLFSSTLLLGWHTAKVLGSGWVWKKIVDFLFLSVTRSSSRRVLCNFGITKTTYDCQA